jgi:hypothetical protein
VSERKRASRASKSISRHRQRQVVNLIAADLVVGSPELGTATLGHHQFEARPLTVGVPEIGTAVFRQHHRLKAKSLSVWSPETGGKSPRPVVHRLRHAWEAKPGKPPAFTKSRERELQVSLATALQTRPKMRPDQALKHVRDQMTDAERKNVEDSTVRTRIVRPVYPRKN